MSRMLSKMNLISIVQQLPKKDIETIQCYVEMIEDENQELKKQLEAKEVQQKEFIELLEGMYFETDDIWYIKILTAYKKIIGDK